MKLRVATLNIWNRQGPWESRRDLIKRELAALAPDLCGLQEVLRVVAPAGASAQAVADASTPAADQSRELAEGLGYHTAYATAWHIGGGLSFGNALLSRWPVRETRTLELPNAGTSEARSALYALVEAPFGAVPVFVTHLNWKFHHGYVRLEQVRALAAWIMELAPTGSGFPPVLLGDFNAEPDSDEIRYLRGLSVQHGRSVYFCDAFAYAGDGGPGATFCRENGFAAVAHEQSRRIDYVFVRGPDRDGRGKPLSARLCFTARLRSPAGDVWPSDHYGVVCDLQASPIASG